MRGEGQISNLNAYGQGAEALSESETMQYGMSRKGATPESGPTCLYSYLPLSLLPVCVNPPIESIEAKRAPPTFRSCLVCRSCLDRSTSPRMSVSVELDFSFA